MKDISIISCSISMLKLLIILIKNNFSYNLIILLDLKYNKSVIRTTEEVCLFSISFFILFFLEKYIFIVYSFSLFSKYFSASPNFAQFTINN